MRQGLRVLKKETTIAGLLIVGILFLSLLPDIIKWRRTPPDHVYVPIHNNLQDYALYTNYIRQGLAGQTVLFDRFTTEPHVGILANPFYLVLGRVWRITRIQNAHTVYLVTRILFGLLWALVVYWYIRRSIQAKSGRMLALFFMLYGASMPIVRWSGTAASVSSYMDWWSELDPIVRATFLPAHLTGHILLLLTIAFFTSNHKISKTTSWRSYGVFIFGTVTGFAAGIFHTPSLMLPLLILPLWALCTKQWKRLLVFAVCLPITALSFFALSNQFANMPWILAWNHERLSFAISIPEFLLALGPIVPLSCLGALVTIRQWKNYALWVLWIVIGIGALWVTPYLFQGNIAFFRAFPVSNVRFLQIALNVPFAILASYTLLWIRKRFGALPFSLLCSVFVIMTFIGYPWAIQAKINTLYGGPEIQYPTVTWMQAVTDLNRKGETGAVLTMPFAGLAVAMNTDRFVYIGRAASTINLEEKTDLAWNIYQGILPQCETYALFAKHGITDVFLGYDEQKAHGDLTGYPFLQLTRDFGDAQIFSFTHEKPAYCP